MIRVPVAGSVAFARAAGLQHPNCRHSLSAYLPGVTRAPKHTADPEGDAARQRQRAIERQIRAWKLRAETAIDPRGPEATQARAKVGQWQAAMRAHLAANPDLRRQSAREQIGRPR